MLDNWHRIERIVKWTGLSVNAFARVIGLNRAENLYQIKKGNNGISRELADTIISKYTTISRAWILTGEGEMFDEEQHPSHLDMPVFEVEISKLLSNKETITPNYYVSLPMFNGNDFIAVSMSDSMMPEIPPFALVVFKKVGVEEIIPGKIYYIRSQAYSVLRYVRREMGSTTLRLVPCNTDKYDEIALESDLVEDLFLVNGIIINKTI